MRRSIWSAQAQRSLTRRRTLLTHWLRSARSPVQMHRHPHQAPYGISGRWTWTMRMGHLISTVAWPGFTAYRAPAHPPAAYCAWYSVCSSTAIGFGVWWGCVFTENGQSYDELVWKNLHNDVPSWATGVMNAVAISWLVIAVSCTIAAIGIITALIRRRWWLAGQIAVFAVVCLAVTRIKGLLPRPFIINTESPAANSAPSGHTMLAAACAVILLLTVPRAVRALAGVIGVVWGGDRRCLRDIRTMASPFGCGDVHPAGGGIGPARSGSYAQVRHGRAGSPRLLSERAKSSAAC